MRLISQIHVWISGIICTCPLYVPVCPVQCQSVHLCGCVLLSVYILLRWCQFCFRWMSKSRGQSLLPPSPPGYLQPLFHPLLLIPPCTGMGGTIPEKKTKQCKNSRERGEGEGRGGGSHALSYFLNDGDQSGGVGQREEGRIQTFEDRGRRVHGSPDHLILSPHLSEEVKGGLH